jgi:hypothetical protein
MAVLVSIVCCIVIYVAAAGMASLAELGTPGPASPTVPAECFGEEPLPADC